MINFSKCRTIESVEYARIKYLKAYKINLAACREQKSTKRFEKKNCFLQLLFNRTPIWNLSIIQHCVLVELDWIHWNMLNKIYFRSQLTPSANYSMLYFWTTACRRRGLKSCWALIYVFQTGIQEPWCQHEVSVSCSLLRFNHSPAKVNCTLLLYSLSSGSTSRGALAGGGWVIFLSRGVIDSLSM